MSEQAEDRLSSELVAPPRRPTIGIWVTAGLCAWLLIMSWLAVSYVLRPTPAIHALTPQLGGAYLSESEAATDACLGSIEDRFVPAGAVWWYDDLLVKQIDVDWTVSSALTIDRRMGELTIVGFTCKTHHADDVWVIVSLITSD